MLLAELCGGKQSYPDFFANQGFCFIDEFVKIGFVDISYYDQINKAGVFTQGQVAGEEDFIQLPQLGDHLFNDLVKTYMSQDDITQGSEQGVTCINGIVFYFGLGVGILHLDKVHVLQFVQLQANGIAANPQFFFQTAQVHFTGGVEKELG